MKSVLQLRADRIAAGAAYAAAAAAYVAAFVELHAHDQALGNANVDAGRTVTGRFSELQAPSAHGEFMRDPLHGDAYERARARAAEIVNSLEG